MSWLHTGYGLRGLRRGNTDHSRQKKKDDVAFQYMWYKKIDALKSDDTTFDDKRLVGRVLNIPTNSSFLRLHSN